MGREGDSNRPHAAVRGALPALVTATLLQAGFVVQSTATNVVAAWSQLVVLPANALANGGLYVLSIVVALRLAARLDRRPYAAYGLYVDRARLRGSRTG